MSTDYDTFRAGHDARTTVNVFRGSGKARVKLCTFRLPVAAVGGDAIVRALRALGRIPFDVKHAPQETASPDGAYSVESRIGNAPLGSVLADWLEEQLASGSEADSRVESRNGATVAR